MHFNIGGFQKNTLIDFPGVVASLVFTQGCNFSCPYCHNPALIPFYPFQTDSHQTNLQKNINTQANKYFETNQLINVNEIFAFLKKRKGLIDGVAITGGEPTFQTGLEPFCFRLKNMGLKVKLDTNGSRPDVIENLIKRELVDFIAMDIKSNCTGYQYFVKDGEYCLPINAGSEKSKCSSEKIKHIKFDFSLILKSIKLIMKHAPDYEFRTTCIKPFISQEIMTEIGKMIKGASHYVIQHCSKNSNMLNPLFFQKNNPYPNPFFSDDELDEFKLIVEPYVERCSIR
ncbi:MAG: anaerobic ribonucleoside-triphosphate reductase activating protein [Desulfamplus sp.]|nr:anaerobic ribonucleoside-triphosphate reductase activating protein [Desulfamplus sp.]